MQYATPVPFRGGRVRYRGWLRTREVASGWAGLWLRVDGPDREVLEFDNLGAVTLAFGVLLVGDGVLWADDLSLEALAS